MKICHCALPALNGNNECCKNCGNNQEYNILTRLTVSIPDEHFFKLKDNLDYLREQSVKNPENKLIQSGIQNLEEKAKKIRRHIND